MRQENIKQLNLSLLLPVGLLLLEIVAVIVLIASGYKITEFLLTFFILLGVFLIFQITRQLFTTWRVKRAVKQINAADELADSDQPLEAIKIYKNNLLSLPRERFLNVLFKMQRIYEEQNMIAAIQQVKAIHSESIEFFEMTQNIKRASYKDRRNWQARAIELRNMIKSLPVEKGQSLSDTKPD